MSFHVGVNKLKSWQDIKSDINGVYPVTLQVATWTVEVGGNNHVEILEMKQEFPLKNEQSWSLRSIIRTGRGQGNC